MKDAGYWIKSLELIEHPEGGYFRETYRSPEAICKDSLPARYEGDRSFSTSIYFLLIGEQFSAFHQLKSDELWHFYVGSPLTIHIIDEDGNYSTTKLGRDLEKGEVFQTAIEAGSCCPSPSIRITYLPDARRMPVFRAAPYPLL